MPPTAVAETVSSAFMSFWMSNISVEQAALTPLIETYYGAVDEQRVFFTLLFLNLSFFFSPLYVTVSGASTDEHERRATNPPRRYQGSPLRRLYDMSVCLSV